jgi:tetratricopeptide (TPR) repeat protein
MSVVLVIAALRAALGVAPAGVAADSGEWQAVYQHGNRALAAGNYSQAAGEFEKSLTLVSGADDRDARKSMSQAGMALAYKKLHRYDDAADHYRQAVELCQRSARERPRELAIVLDNFGNLYDEQGKLAEGEPLHRQALGVFEKVLPADDPHLITCRANLAAGLDSLGRYDEAAPLYEQSLQAVQDKPERREMYATLLDNYGGMLARQGKLDESLAKRQKALKMFEEALGPNHPEVAICCFNIGRTYLQQGKPKEAEPMFRRSLTIGEKTFGHDHRALISVLEALSVTMNGLAQPDEAEKFALRAKEIRARYEASTRAVSS